MSKPSSEDSAFSISFVTEFSTSEARINRADGNNVSLKFGKQFLIETPVSIYTEEYKYREQHDHYGRAGDQGKRILL